MNRLCLICIVCFIETPAFSQDIVGNFKEVYNNADFDCYEQKIQEDISIFDSIINKFQFELSSIQHGPVRPSNIILSEEKKVFLLAVTYANTQDYKYEDNIYDFIIIDSLRTFIILTVDSEMNIIGFTDTREPGSYVDIKDDFYFPRKKDRKQIRVMLKNILKEEPDLIMYCDGLDGAFLFIRGNEIFIYNRRSGCVKELNEWISEIPDITYIRKLNIMLTPLSKILKNDRSFDKSVTGNTSAEEVRICPPISK